MLLHTLCLLTRDLSSQPVKDPQSSHQLTTITGKEVTGFVALSVNMHQNQQTDKTFQTHPQIRE
jgi:hypothetical protein